MPIQLDELHFNFDPERFPSDRLSSHKDAARFGPFAADVAKGNLFFDEFVITRARTTDAPVEIILKFSSLDSTLAGAEVRAIASQPNLLGDVPSTWVDFDRSGKSSEVIVSLPEATLPKGVQSHSVIWEWQHRTTESGDWISFKTTRQRVYCTFGPATCPWGDNEPPWPEVLEVACNWAQGAQDEPTAATRITEAVFDLGRQGRVTYSHGSTYANAKFDCAAFLDLLNTGVGLGKKLNCDDCASIVSTFGNILGCSLYQSEMWRNFEINFVRVIGVTGWVTGGFDRHAVAWKEDCESKDSVYDACLQLDGDGEPSSVDQSLPFQPCNVIFGVGSPQDNDYRFCLQSVDSPCPCEPKPELKQRRKLGKSYFAQRRFTDDDYLNVLKTRYGFEGWSNDKRIKLNILRPSLPDFITNHIAFAGFKRVEVNKFEAIDLESVDQVVLLIPEHEPKRMVEVYVYVCAEEANPNDFLLQVLAQFNSPQTHREPDVNGAADDRS